jgi:hypothetical protein
MHAELKVNIGRSLIHVVPGVLILDVEAGGVTVERAIDHTGVLRELSKASFANALKEKSNAPPLEVAGGALLTGDGGRQTVRARVHGSRIGEGAICSPVEPIFVVEDVTGGAAGGTIETR